MTTLPYDLAKQIKDAGYPQKDSSTAGGVLLWEPGIGWPSESDIKAGRFAYSPCLSELIDACPKTNNYTVTPGVVHLHRFSLTCINDDGTLWEAHYVDNEGECYWPPEGEGKTPEEAVANLWLALKEKNIAG